MYGRYQREIVEDLGLCPWAERARRDGAVAVRVVTAPEPTVRDALEVIDALAAERSVEIGLLLLPASRLGRLDFEHWVGEVRAAHAAAHALGAAIFAMAAFHPDAPEPSSDAERLIPYLRRTPDPTVQLVRLETLERVRSGSPEGTQFVDLDTLDPRALLDQPAKPSLRARIARANLETISRVGHAAFDAKIREIFRDRDEAYGALGVGARATP